MAGEDIFRALSEIDDELLVIPNRSAIKVRKGKKRKKLMTFLVAAIALLALCGFGYAARLEMTYGDGVLQISAYNPNVVEEYEQWSMEYLAEGYEIIQVSETMWEITNENTSFYLSQIHLSEDTCTTSEVEVVSGIDEITILENTIALDEEFLKTTRIFYWKTKSCIYRVLILEKPDTYAELVAMIQSIKP